MNPSAKSKLIDVACGTGDIAQIYLRKVSAEAEITCVDPNKKMIKKDPLIKSKHVIFTKLLN